MAGMSAGWTREDPALSEQSFRRPPGQLNRDEFLAVYGGVYEHSPWIAEAVFDAGLTRQHDAVDGLHRALAAVVDAAPRERRLALLRAHPDLAGRLAMRGDLTAASTAEQASAGLDKCTPEEFARFGRLNEAYREKFGFPFVMAVRGRSRAEILAAFERRLANDAGTELATAIEEVHKIALLRLCEL